LIVCTGLGFGGAETQIIALAHGLRAKGHTVGIYTLMTGTDRANQVRQAGFDLWEDGKTKRLDWSLIKRLRKVVREWRPNLIHGYLFDGNLYARLAAFGFGVPVLSAERSSDYALRRSQKIAHYGTRWLTTAVVANSWAGADLAKRMYPGLQERVHVVWNGIDVDQVRKRVAVARADKPTIAIPAGAKLACFVGSFKPEKDLLLAVEVTRHLQQSSTPWHVLFIGAVFPKTLFYGVAELAQSEHYAAQVEAAFATLPHPERIHRVAATPKVIELMSQCDALFSTSVREGFPNVVLEAMTAGVPVVSTQYSDIRRILPNEWQVSAERDPAALAAAIERAVEEPGLGERQKAWVDQNTSLTRAVDTLENIYQKYAKP
jgi:glycosyltransferase involved in cell wall biosynthesis